MFDGVYPTYSNTLGGTLLPHQLMPTAASVAELPKQIFYKPSSNLRGANSSQGLSGDPH